MPWESRHGVAGQRESQERGENEGNSALRTAEGLCSMAAFPGQVWVLHLGPQLAAGGQGSGCPTALNGIAASGDGGQQMHSGLCLWRQILPHKSIHCLLALHFGLWKVLLTCFPQASVSYIASNNVLPAERSAFKTLGRQKTTRHISVLPIQHQGLLPQNTWHQC